MTADKLNRTLLEISLDRSSPFFEEAVMAGIDRPKWSDRLRKPVALIVLAVIASLSFIVPSSGPMRVDAHVDLATTITQADVFNFALSGKLPVDKSSGQYIELTPDGNLLTVAADSFGLRYHPVESFYRTLNVEFSSMRHFDSLLESYADQLSTARVINSSYQIAHADLLSLNRNLAREMMAMATGSKLRYISDSLSLFFRLSMQQRLIRSEDSLLAAADTLPPFADAATLVIPAGLSEKPSTSTLQMPMRVLEDSIESLTRGSTLI